MDQREIGLQLTLDALGVPLKIVSFDDRLILQKTIYLAWAARIDLGYGYSWYLRGPYSSDLTRDAFSLVAADISDDDLSAWQLDPKSQRRLSKLRPIFDEFRGKRRARRLELLASVHYLVERTELCAAEPNGLALRLRQLGKNFTSNDAEHAVDVLEKYGLLKRKPKTQHRR